jgi:hypothetical protein
MEGMRVELSDIEIRVLGVLIEKSLTQASSYPLTLNAITVAANQLHNRDPVARYTEEEVSAAVRNLQYKKLVVLAAPAPGARVNRFAHNVVEVFHWDRREQAIMAELMLRGRQTAGELRSRASRMTPFPDVEAVQSALNVLMTAAEPFVEELPREPGRSANRFRHLLGGGGESAPPRVEPEFVPTPAGRADPISIVIQRLDSLEARIDALEREIRPDRGREPAATIDSGEPPEL